MSTVSSYLNPLSLFDKTPAEATLENRDKILTQQSVASRGWKVGVVCTVVIGAIALHRFSKMQGLLPARLADSGFLQDYLSLRNQTIALTTLTLVSTGYTLLFVAAARKERPDVAALGYHQELMLTEFVSVFENDKLDLFRATATHNLTLKINAGTTAGQAYVKFYDKGSCTTPGDNLTKVRKPTLAFTEAAQMTGHMINDKGLFNLADTKGYVLTESPEAKPDQTI